MQGSMPTRELFAGNKGRQIKARLILHQMSAHGIGSKADREA